MRCCLAGRTAAKIFGSNGPVAVTLGFIALWCCRCPGSSLCPCTLICCLSSTKSGRRLCDVRLHHPMLAARWWCSYYAAYSNPTVLETPAASDGRGNVRRYGLNIGFNLLNKTVFNYFPFPWTVSAIHVLVGTLYCGVTYLLGFKEASFGRVCRRHPHAADH